MFISFGEVRRGFSFSAMSVVIAYFLIYVVWGSTYFFIGLCLRDMPPFALGAVRFIVAEVCSWRYAGCAASACLSPDLC